MALKKSELYASIWTGCDELRGGMDASQYKDYVLTILFLKYISDRASQSLLDIPTGATFRDIALLKGDKEIGDKINKIIARIADANDLRGVIDVADFNDSNKLGNGKAMVDRLSKLVGIFEDLDFGANNAAGDDLLGDAYEYLMRHFSTEAGKSKGQFYTPAEVSMILARVLRIGEVTDPATTVYDPTCGSGSLLLKAAHEAQSDMSVYGQEMDNSTWALARMNMILHGYETAEIWGNNDSTLTSPHFIEQGKLKAFDFVVANPPFSTKAWTTGFDPAQDEFGRFEGFGIPPKKNGDYAFLLHILKSLKPSGRGAVILPHGVLFRGNREADIRKQLVDRRLISGIIGLPANVFYGTGIPACVVVLDKQASADRKGIFMIDASQGFRKDGNKNRLRERDVHQIVDVFTQRREIEHYSRLVPFDEIAGTENAYNLNLPRYINRSEPADVQDLDAHFNGGIPERDIELLCEYWDAYPSLRSALLQPKPKRPGYAELSVHVDEVRETISKHPEFRLLEAELNTRLASWIGNARSDLEGAASRTSGPELLIKKLSEDFLQAFEGTPLVDPYALYQHIMDYWTETMRDDAYLLLAGGWSSATALRVPREKEKESISFKAKGQKKAIKFVADVIPPELVISRYFQTEWQTLQTAVAVAEAARSERASYEEDHSGDGESFEGLADEGEAIAKGTAQDRASEIKQTLLDTLDEHSPEYEQARSITKSGFGRKPWNAGVQDEEQLFRELDDLHTLITLMNSESAARAEAKKAEESLNIAVFEKFEALGNHEAMVLVIDDKWIASIKDFVAIELAQAARSLAKRLMELHGRYDRPLPALEVDCSELRSLMHDHLRRMGISWN